MHCFIVFFQDLFSLQENSTCDTHDLIACSCLSDVGGLQEVSDCHTTSVCVWVCGCACVCVCVRACMHASL